MDLFTIDLVPPPAKPGQTTALSRAGDSGKPSFRDALARARDAGQTHAADSPNSLALNRAAEAGRDRPAAPDSNTDNTVAGATPRADAVTGKTDASEGATSDTADGAEAQTSETTQDTPADTANGQPLTTPAATPAQGAPAAVQALVQLATQLGGPNLNAEALVEAARQLAGEGAANANTTLPDPAASDHKPDVDALIQAAKQMGGAEVTEATVAELARRLAGQAAETDDAVDTPADADEDASETAAPGGQANPPLADAQGQPAAAEAKPAGTGFNNIPAPPTIEHATPTSPPPPANDAQLAATTGPTRPQDTALQMAHSDRPAEVLAAVDPNATNKGRGADGKPIGDRTARAIPAPPGVQAKADEPAPNTVNNAPVSPTGGNTSQGNAEQTPAQQAQARLANLAASFAAMSVDRPIGVGNTFTDQSVFFDRPPVDGLAQFGLGEPNGGANSLAQSMAAMTRSQAATVQVTHQVAVQISQAVQAGANRITVQLYPAELGRIEVKIELAENGRLSAMVVVDRPETLDMMQRDARALERALQQAGLDTDSDSLQFNLRDEDEGADEALVDDPSQDSEEIAGPDDGEADPGEITLAEAVTMITEVGGVDIRV